MSRHVCPWWVGYLLLSPFRRVLHNPRRWFGPFVHEGMTVLEPGPAMGYFTLDLAHMVGPSGRVIAVDVQPRMIARLRERAARAGLGARIDARLVGERGLEIDDCRGRVDLTVAIFMVHELPEGHAFFAEVHRALRPGGRLIVAEPRLHVSRAAFERSIERAIAAGFRLEDRVPFRGPRAAALSR